MSGFFNSSELDFLKEKLGADLYQALCDYYNASVRPDVSAYTEAISRGENLEGFAALLYLSQRAVVFDALARAVSVHAVSINGSGVNIASAEDYASATSQAISEFKKSCVKESHAAVNELLQAMEQWACDYVGEEVDSEVQEICALWKKSRFYYLVASLIIPSAKVLQEYYNIYDSREKFIQYLPELRYIQEDIIAPIFGEDLVDFISAYPWMERDACDKHVLRISHSLRKIMARYLESRLLNASDTRSEMARNEAVKLTTRLSDYLQAHQADFRGQLAAAFESSPLYVERGQLHPKAKRFVNNGKNSVIFVTPGLI